MDSVEMVFTKQRSSLFVESNLANLLLMCLSLSPFDQGGTTITSVSANFPSFFSVCYDG